VAVYAPAFDVTPSALITAIVTDRGVVRGALTAASGGGEAERAPEAAP
jgi:methylthioribose-1-phosphate isomerase